MPILWLQTNTEKKETAKEMEAKAYAYSTRQYRAQEAYEKRERARARRPKIIAVLIVLGIIVFSLTMVLFKQHSDYLKLPEINPFENIKISFSGISGNGTVKIENKK